MATNGSDSADGVAAPVKTIKRAIEIAVADSAIKMISLDAGKYNAANGEKYPYTLPTGVKLVGAAGTTLAGSNAEDGLVVDTGTVENLEFSDFKTALRATSTVTLTSVTVKTSNVGLLADGAANVQATAFTIVGDAECKTIGVKALGPAQVTLRSYVATDALALDGRDQSVVAITNGSISAKPTICFPQVKMFGRSLALTDTTITGGRSSLWLNHDRGVPFTKNEQLDVKLTNTTLADAGETAMISEVHELQMSGGEIRNNGHYGVFLLGSGMQTFTGVGMKGNSFGMASAEAGVRSKVRSCSIATNRIGIVVYAAASTDLGTAADPGNNSITNNHLQGLFLDSASGLKVFAAGNRWIPNTDGADGSGKYSQQLITGVHEGRNILVNIEASSVQL